VGLAESSIKVHLTLGGGWAKGVSAGRHTLYGLLTLLCRAATAMFKFMKFRSSFLHFLSKRLTLVLADTPIAGTLVVQGDQVIQQHANVDSVHPHNCKDSGW
jgi:hypothetical protein